MADQIPITSDVLRWARERAGLSTTEAARNFPNIEAWEAGRSNPTYAQLEKLANAFKVPIAVFFFPSPPDVPPIGRTFRSLPDSEIENLPSRIHLLLRKAKALQLSLHELTNGQNPAPRVITKETLLTPGITVAELARKTRHLIGVSVQEQQQWKDLDTAQKAWRAALLKVGVFVFKDAFKVNEFSGFCLYDEDFPVIYVNNSSTKSRQIFTYFHELAHLLYHTSGIDPLDNSYIARLHGTDQQIEVFCNQFASEFLLPDEYFSAAANHLDRTENAAEQLADQFKVSREVIFRRFLDRNEIQQWQYESAVHKWNQQRQSSGEGGGDYYWTKLTYLGREYVSLALGQYHRNNISDIQLAEYLDTKSKNVSTLEEYFERGI